MLCKGRRIKDNEVVFIIRSVQELESILTESLMTFVAREIEFHVLSGEFDGFS